jgi:hypothetical protein
MSKIETKIEETKEVVLKRVPPGDRWCDIKNQTIILESLTDALEYHFQNNGETQFFLDARKGTVEIIRTKEVKVEKPITKYSLYGEE